MNRIYKYRIFPTKEQKEFLLKELELIVLYWNLSISFLKKDYRYRLTSCKETFSKYKPEKLEQLFIIDSGAMSLVWYNLKKVFDNYVPFRGGVKIDNCIKPLEYKSMNNFQEPILYPSTVKPKLINGKLFITRKIGLLRGIFDEQFCEGKLKYVKIDRASKNEWYVSFYVDDKYEKVEIKKIENTNGKAVGITIDCSGRDEDFLVLSDGTKIEYPSFIIEKEKNLSKYQKLLQKKFVEVKQEQSKSYYSVKCKVDKLKKEIFLQKQNWLDDISNDLALKYQYIYFSKMNIQDMEQKYPKLYHGKYVSDQDIIILQAKLRARNAFLLNVSGKDIFKTCHCCGYVNPTNTFNYKKWECPYCSAKLDRDINAAQTALRRGTIRLEEIPVEEDYEKPKRAVDEEISTPYSRVYY